MSAKPLKTWQLAAVWLGFFLTHIVAYFAAFVAIQRLSFPVKRLEYFSNELWQVHWILVVVLLLVLPCLTRRVLPRPLRNPLCFYGGMAATLWFVSNPGGLGSALISAMLAAGRASC